MKKAALLLLGLAAVAMVTWYIFDPETEARWIGYQSDNMDTQVLSQMHPSVSAESSAGISHETGVMEKADIQPALPAISEAPEGWELVWSDEFEAPQLNMEYWTEMNREDNYNGELQYYTPANSCIDNGCLTLTARKEAMGGHQYTSGMVQTFGKLEVLYGRIEAKISLPVAQGIFPAFWLTTDSDLHEIDVLEMVGCEPGNIYGVCHYKKNNRATKTYGMIHIIDPCEFHVYAVEWETDEVRWYVDDTQFFSTITGVPDEALYVILTLAVGGVWPGNPDQTTQLPLSMKVDYIRIYDWKTSGLGGTYDIS